MRSLSKSDSRVFLSDANVHDILKQAIVTVSMNSTLALEGFVHRTPAILFGQAEFHHIAGRVVAPNTFAEVFSVESQRKGGFAQYLSWYFQQCCLQLTEDSFNHRV